MSSDSDSPQFAILAWILVLWCGLWMWMLWKRSSKLTLRKIFVIITGCAILCTLAAPPAQDYLRSLYDLDTTRIRLLLDILGCWAIAVIIIFKMTRKD